MWAVAFVGAGVKSAGSTLELALLHGRAGKQWCGAAGVEPVLPEGEPGLDGFCGEAGIAPIEALAVEAIDVRVD